MTEQKVITGPTPAQFIGALAVLILLAHVFPRQVGIKLLGLLLIMALILHRQTVERAFRMVEGVA